MIASTDRLGPNRRVPGTDAVRWARAYRRTRPFWGGLWLMLGGLVVIKLNSYPLGVAMAGSFNRSAGYILGGAMVMFGLVAWVSPIYARLVGLFGVLAAMAAFVGSNLGGFLVGTVLGIIGGSMIWGWGELRPRRGKGSPGRTRSRRGRRTGSVA
ncbi:DUF6114 domain-containing protein [Nocardioides cavernaquae]|uniref:Uncharacterized protein n=1 Tax=Nocardioides cavernaquae TaxID=2321396 RepID=A0A3A5HBT2_9ACTN|nr:DUF6114 domain-containing protein [Nocardioides cavernaquae]RJS45514.1 hypothetical protein D4739_04290 [Nocardioides cavernaquae]